MRRFCLSKLVFVTLICGISLAAQSNDARDLLLKRLNEQFVPTKFTADKSDIVAAGMVDGLNRPGGAASIPAKRLVTGEKVWVRAIEVAKDSITVQVVTDPYDDGRYFATIKFLTPKGTFPTPDAPPPIIELGQTKDQVTAGFGPPLRLANLGAKTIFYYKDMKVTFTNGKVSNVE
jgi:hypothetical protein